MIYEYNVLSATLKPTILYCTVVSVTSTWCLLLLLLSLVSSLCRFSVAMKFLGLTFLPVGYGTLSNGRLSLSQTMSHIVESCLLTKLNGGLSRLHSADEDAVSWLTNYGKWHAYEKKKTDNVVHSRLCISSVTNSGDRCSKHRFMPHTAGWCRHSVSIVAWSRSLCPSLLKVPCGYL